MRSAAQLIIPIIFPRAVVLWALIRLALATVPLGGGGAFGSMSPPPIGVIILSCIVGLIDVRARGERVLWANLGVTPLGLSAVYAAAATSGEIILPFVLR